MTTDEITTTEFDSDSLHDESLPPSIVQIYGGQIGRRFVFGSSDITVGRGRSNVVSIELSTVSRHHARMFREGDRCFLEDLGSTNGSFINGERIDGTREITSGDLIKLGGAVFKFIAGGTTEALYYEEIYRLTIIDGLTQIPNKRYLVDFLDREMARAKRHQRPLYLVMADIDHFKLVNDEFGHVVGDAILRDVAEILQNEVRRDELVARYGGEEFAIVLPETELAGAEAFSERVRGEIANRTFSHDGHQIRLTMSFGLAAFEPDLEMNEFIQAADRRLYRAKELGRNQIVVDGTE